MDRQHRAVEAVVIDPGFWKGKRVFLTGHTGFKGGWTVLVLKSFGADVHGFALAPDTDPSLFDIAGLARDCHHVVGDLRDQKAVADALIAAKPDIVLHMGAQALVRRSYVDPVYTYAANVMGTAHVLDAVRHAPSVKAAVIVTTDKCYDNVNWVWGYRETDRLGGHDPYSNSKAAAELVVDSFRRSFFDKAGTAVVASARAGNVIGGGDWSADRLVPDAMRAFAAGNALPGLAGFRQSHRQAFAARTVALAPGAPPRRVTAANEPGLVVAAQFSSDLENARSWVGQVLGPLASDNDSDERLRDTLAEFLRNRSSFKASAYELHIHVNSVKYRVQRALERRGRPIENDHLDVEVALLLCHWYGRAVLAPAKPVNSGGRPAATTTTLRTSTA